MIDFDWWRRANSCIGQGALTNSKHPDRHVFGAYPTHFSRGEGCYLFTPRPDSRRYIDLIGGLGANLFGYGAEKLSAHLSGLLRDGFSHSFPTTTEVQAAEALKGAIPFIEKMRFLKTGSEACTAALRIARTYTGRLDILSEGYHGWHDEFVSLTPPAHGVILHSFINPLTGINAINEKVAGVIVEPVITDNSEARIKWLRELRERCTRTGTVLIFDETITGFRYPKFCLSRFHHIVPDILILGKSIAGGLPLSVVAGKADLMDSPYFVSSTFAGETLSLSAMIKCIDLLTHDHEFKIEKLWAAGERLMTAINGLLPDRFRMEGYPTRGVFRGDPLDLALVYQEAAKCGLLLCNSWVLSFPVIMLIDGIIEVLNDILKKLETGSLHLEGKLPSSPFAEKVRKRNG